MVSENDSFCYDALNRMVWAGNSGTPTGGDHCMRAPSTSGISSYSQAYSYDSLDRLTGSSAGSSTYGNANHVHAVTSVSSVPNQYAAYDAMGDMICRNTDTTTGHTCAGGTPTGATMTYDNEGRLASWAAPSGSSANETYLYDTSGNLVLTTSSVSGTPTDTITFDNYTDTVLTGGTTTTTKYYSVNGQRLAEKVNGTLSYLISDLLGNQVMALTSSGSQIAVILYEPYGTMNYAWGTMPTAHNYTGQRLDSQSGLLYYNFRWYDPFTGQFVRTDTTETNARGMDPYGYVGDDPESRADPTGQRYVDEQGDFANIDPEGNVTIFEKLDRIYASPDLPYNGIYQVWHYTAVQVRQPVSQPPPSAPGNVIQQLVGGAIALNPADDAACVAAPEACLVVGIIIVGGIFIFIIGSALGHGGGTPVSYSAGDVTPGGKFFTQHGADAANEDGFTAQIIDRIIRTGRKIYQQVPVSAQDPTGIRIKYVDSKGNTVILDASGDDIITVYGKDGPDNPDGKYQP